MKKFLLFIGLVFLVSGSISAKSQFDGYYHGEDNKKKTVISKDNKTYFLETFNRDNDKDYVKNPFLNFDDCNGCSHLNLDLFNYYETEKELMSFLEKYFKQTCKKPIIEIEEFVNRQNRLLGWDSLIDLYVKCPEIELEKELAEQKEKEKSIKQEQEVEAQKQVDSQQKKMETCQAYGFKKGSETFGECIFKLMELDLEYAKLENEQLRLEAQSEQARLNNDTALANSYSAQAQASNRDKALRIQQFGLAMQGIAKSFETPQSSITPTITCNKIGSITNCW